MIRVGASIQSALIAVLAASCGAAPTTVTLPDLDGVLHAPMAVADGQVHVLVFTSHECPIANSYAPTLRELASGWANAPVRLFLIHVDPDLTSDAARAHARAYELPGTILLDPRQLTAQAVGATKTPEAVVLTTKGLVYRGRIDDQWSALGARTPAAGKYELRDAVTRVLAGGPAPFQSTPVVGCVMPEPRR